MGPAIAEVRLWGTPWGEIEPQRSGVRCIQAEGAWASQSKHSVAQVWDTSSRYPPEHGPLWTQSSGHSHSRQVDTLQCLRMEVKGENPVHFLHIFSLETPFSVYQYVGLQDKLDCPFFRSCELHLQELAIHISSQSPLRKRSGDSGMG